MKIYIVNDTWCDMEHNPEIHNGTYIYTTQKDALNKVQQLVQWAKQELNYNKHMETSPKRLHDEGYYEYHTWKDNHMSRIQEKITLMEFLHY